MRDRFIKWFKDLFKKEAIKRILGSAAGGFKLFLVKIGLHYLWKELLGPSVKYLLRKATKFFHKIKYKKKAKRLENAETDDEFDSAVDDMP